MTTTTPGRPRGRPRSADIDERVLAVTRDVLGTEGYRAVSMDAIAQRAGVGRQSLYRRWPRKPLLVFDAMWGGRARFEAELPDTGSLRGDLAALAAQVAENYATEPRRQIARGMLSDALADPIVMDELRQRFMWPRLEVTQRIVERARERGEIGPGISAGMIAELLLGAVIAHFVILGRDRASFAGEVTDLIVAGLGAH